MMKLPTVAALPTPPASGSAPTLPIPDGEGVYLLAFFYRGRHIAYGGASPRGRALHYLGYARDIRRRIGEHITGEGSRLCRAVSLAGYELRVVRVWNGRGRDFERSIKDAHNLARVCPLCAYRLDTVGEGARSADVRRSAPIFEPCEPFELFPPPGERIHRG